jgi:hypothetical protein
MWQVGITRLAVTIEQEMFLREIMVLQPQQPCQWSQGNVHE